MKNYLNTPIGKIPFDEEKNKYYNNLTDIEVVELYLEEEELMDFVNPETFEMLKKRNLITAGETKQDLVEKYNELKKENKNE